MSLFCLPCVRANWPQGSDECWPCLVFLQEITASTAVEDVYGDDDEVLIVEEEEDDGDGERSILLAQSDSTEVTPKTPKSTS